MKLTEIRQKNIWVPNKNGEVKVSSMGLSSLKGAPKIVNGSFYACENQLRSMVGGPKRVMGTYTVFRNYITSLDGIPEYVDGNLSIARNHITSLHNIHKMVKYIGGALLASYNPIESCILGAFLIKGVDEIRIYPDPYTMPQQLINNIVDSIKDPVERMLTAQQQLIEAGFPELAKL